MFRHLLYPFLAYRSVVAPFLVVSAFAVPCWLLFRLYRLRSSGRRPSLSRELLLVTFVLYLSGLAAATLAPNRGSSARLDGSGGLELRPSLTTLTCPSTLPSTGPGSRFFCRYNARGNVLLFFPLGVLLPLVLPHLRFWRGMLIAAALSVGIELVQYLSQAWGSYRHADINDVVLNGLGAALGLLVGLLLRWRPRRRLATQRA